MKILLTWIDIGKSANLSYMVLLPAEDDYLELIY